MDAPKRKSCDREELNALFAPRAAFRLRPGRRLRKGKGEWWRPPVLATDESREKVWLDYKRSANGPYRC